MIEQQIVSREPPLGPRAARAADAVRRRPEEPCPFRTAFQRDRDRILHTTSFRRLKHKTQVFVAPAGDHYRTRLTHTLEVSAVARTVARALELNEDLVEAIAMGHDLGHAPFGHAGEVALDGILRDRYGRRYEHNVQSLRIVDVLERGGEGLNLTEDVRDGILNHTGSGRPLTLEGQIVRLMDRIAYVNHDIEDALRAGVISVRDLPPDDVAVLGTTTSERLTTLVADTVNSSRDGDEIRQSRAHRAGVPAAAQVHVPERLPGAAGQHRGRPGPGRRAVPLRLVRRPPGPSAAGARGGSRRPASPTSCPA